MDWINWFMLGSGLGIGAIGGWLAAKQNKQQANSALDGEGLSVAIPHTPDTPASATSAAGSAPSEIDTSPSEVQLLKEELQRTQLAYRMAKEMGQFKAGFLARTSHELRSPINSVISLHQLILSDLCEDPAEEREFVAQANTAAQKMLSLMDQLIKVAKASHGTEQLKIQPLSLIDVLLEAQQFTYLQAKNRNLRLEIELPEDEVFVLADPNWLRQVLVGLIDTPISLMQEGTIHLTTQVDSEAGFAQIWIDDERSADFWQEPSDLLHSEPSSDTSPVSLKKQTPEELEDVTSPGLVLLVSQTLLELMGGRLDLLMVPSSSGGESAEPQANLTRIQCLIPIAAM
jgi:signal transduction histidine kinase